MALRAVGAVRGLRLGTTSRPSLCTGLRSVKRFPVVFSSSNGKSSATEVDVDPGNLGAYCSIDEMGQRVKKSQGEMEQEFLSALSAWYYDGKPSMSNEEFELLKEELLWSGSKVAILDSDELRFLEASQAYAQGHPIMSDEDYDALKSSLKQKSSVIAAEGPRCSIRSKKMYSDAVVDYTRMTLLNIPASLLILGFIFAIDDVTGFEITKAIELPPPLGLGLLWGLLLPTVYVLATSLTNIAFKDFLILKGTCPSCGEENITYFGEVLTVSGNKGQNQVDCVKCGAGLTVDEYKRIIVVDETAEDKQKKAAALAAKKAASAAKKKARPAAASE